MRISVCAVCLLLLIITATFIGCDNGTRSKDKTPALVNGELYARGSEARTSSSEAVMNFSYRVQVDVDEFADTSSPEAMRPIFLSKINDQIQHLFGAFKIYTQQGVPKLGRNQSIVIDEKSIEFNSRKKYYTAKYQYRGNALVDIGAGDSIQLPLPRNPDTIYYKSKGQNRLNPCTDKHYNTEGDFWYFWNVFYYGCNTIKEGVDYDLVEISLTRITNTEKTFPEYDRLIRLGAEGKKSLAVYVFFGYVHELSKVPKDLSGVEHIGESFKAVSKQLMESGFAQSEFSRLSSAAVLYKFEKYFSQSNLTIAVNLFAGNTGINDSDSAIFHNVYKQALEQGSVIFYGGHSGLGGNLKIKALEKRVGTIVFPKDQYQIIVFDSCSSFPYYTELYFDNKANVAKADGSVDTFGSYNFDIITNGLSSYFERNSVSINTLLAALNTVYESGIAKSFQELIDEMHANHFKASSKLEGHMVAVSGDEDNPTVAPVLDINLERSNIDDAVAIAATVGRDSFNFSIESLDAKEIMVQIKGLLEKEALVYLLTSSGKVLYAAIAEEGVRWQASQVNQSNWTGFSYMAYISLPENDFSTLYLMGKDKILYFKDKDKELTKSVRQHPQGLVWIKLELQGDGLLMGTDESNKKYQWEENKWVEIKQEIPE